MQRRTCHHRGSLRFHLREFWVSCFPGNFCLSGNWVVMSFFSSTEASICHLFSHPDCDCRQICCCSQFFHWQIPSSWWLARSHTPIVVDPKTVFHGLDFLLTFALLTKALLLHLLSILKIRPFQFTRREISTTSRITNKFPRIQGIIQMW